MYSRKPARSQHGAVGDGAGGRTEERGPRDAAVDARRGDHRADLVIALEETVRTGYGPCRERCGCARVSNSGGWVRRREDELACK